MGEVTLTFVKFISKLSVFAFFIFALGCAHGVRTKTGTADSSSSSDGSPSVVFKKPEPVSEMTIAGVRLENVDFDLPVVSNPQVEKWVDYFTGRGRKLFERYLDRAEVFIPYIESILQQNGMPHDLVYLALIESGFNNHARSHATAVGPWQFMRFTGTRYGLTVNWWVDERRDVEKSTLAAIRYLKDLYGMFQSWELAAAAYNAGEAKVGRAIKRFRSKDFWEISKHRFLKPETRQYVPKMMAAAILVKNRTQFGFSEPGKPHLDKDEAVAPDGQVVKLEKHSESTDEVAAATASVQDSISNLIEELDDEEDPVSDDDVAEPAIAFETEPKEYPNSAQVLAKPIAIPHVTKKGEIGSDHLAEFEVQSPADLLKVARAAGLSYQTVKSLNPEILRWCTPPHVKNYRIKLPESAKDRFLGTYNHPSFPRSVRFRAYRVRSGDSLKAVAHRFGIKDEPILDLNSTSRLSKVGRLKTGAELLLPIPTDQSRSIASLDLYDPPERRRRHRGKKHRKIYRVTYKHRQAAR